MQPGLLPPDPDDAIPGLDEGAPPPAPAPALTVVPPFATNLKLDKEQEEKFRSESIMRIFELRREMGLSEANDVIAGSWMWLRKNHEAYYQGDLTWRLVFGGIFSKCNITLGSGLRHVRYNSARMTDDLVGTVPYMTVLGKAPNKEPLAKQIDEYIQNQIEEAGIRRELREAQKIALYRNECVVKTGYISDTTPYIGEATVLVDERTGEPIVSPEKGLYFHEDDDLIAHPQIENMGMLATDPSLLVAQHPEEGKVLIPAAGEQPERVGIFQTLPELPQVLTRREGAYAETLDYRSFLCPLKCKNIHEADTVVHLYLETPNRLQKTYGNIDVSQEYFAFWNNPGQDKPKTEQGERNEPTTMIFQQVICAEVFRRCDPDATGEDKECFLVLDMTNQKIIYYNYLANHMAQRPFEVVPGLETVPGRWYGRGVYGMLDSHLFYEDVEASRSFFKNSTDATIQLAYKDAVDEWRNGARPEIGTGDTFWVNATWDMEGKRKVIWRENLNENFEPDVELMNIMRQSADSLVGSISTASANQSGFDQSKTATGNQLVQQGSDIITKATEQDQAEAITRILQQVVNIILEHMDRTTLAADPRTGLIAQINRSEARSFTKDVRLLLTRSKSTQLLNTSTQALDIVDKHYAMMDANLYYAQLRRPLVIAQLKGLEVHDADKLVPEITDEEVAAFQQQKAEAAGQGEPPNESISIKLPDLAGQERVQALAKFGIAADMAAHEAEIQAERDAKSAAKEDGEDNKIPGLD